MRFDPDVRFYIDLKRKNKMKRVFVLKTGGWGTEIQEVYLNF